MSKENGKPWTVATISLVKIRAAELFAIGEGRTDIDIARELGVSQTSVHNWRFLWRRGTFRWAASARWQGSSTSRLIPALIKAGISHLTDGYYIYVEGAIIPEQADKLIAALGSLDPIPGSGAEIGIKTCKPDDHDFIEIVKQHDGVIDRITKWCQVCGVVHIDEHSSNLGGAFRGPHKSYVPTYSAPESEDKEARQ